MLRMPHNRIAVTPLFDTLMYGRIHIPEQARERCDQGIVKYVAKHCGQQDCDSCNSSIVKVGDHIVFSGYTGTLLELEGEGLLIVLPEDFIVSIIEYDGPEVALVDISGLYFKGDDRKYYQATYEMATQLIARGIEDSELWKKLTGPKHRKWKIAGQRPKVSEYDKPR